MTTQISVVKQTANEILRLLQMKDPFGNFNKVNNDYLEFVRQYAKEMQTLGQNVLDGQTSIVAIKAQLVEKYRIFNENLAIDQKQQQKDRQDNLRTATETTNYLNGMAQNQTKLFQAQTKEALVMTQQMQELYNKAADWEDLRTKLGGLVSTLNTAVQNTATVANYDRTLQQYGITVQSLQKDGSTLFETFTTLKQNLEKERDEFAVELQAIYNYVAQQREQIESTQKLITESVNELKIVLKKGTLDATTQNEKALERMNEIVNKVKSNAEVAIQKQSEKINALQNQIPRLNLDLNVQQQRPYTERTPVIKQREAKLDSKSVLGKKNAPLFVDVGYPEKIQFHPPPEVERSNKQNFDQDAENYPQKQAAVMNNQMSQHRLPNANRHQMPGQGHTTDDLNYVDDDFNYVEGDEQLGDGVEHDAELQLDEYDGIRQHGRGNKATSEVIAYIIVFMLLSVGGYAAYKWHKRSRSNSQNSNSSFSSVSSVSSNCSHEYK